MKKEFLFNLQRFSEPVIDSLNKTTSEGLSVENKTFYDKYLIDNAEPNLVHAQFGQKRSIPEHGGKTVEFRKYDPLGYANELEEGITPTGESLVVGKIEATLKQYGSYVPITDVVDMTTIDDNLVEAVELLGDQAGRTLDMVVREVMNGGTNVIYGGGGFGRLMVATLAVDDIRRAVRILKGKNAKPIDGSYVAIIHPYISGDLMKDEAWIDVHKYASPEEIYEGEIGKLFGVRFVETSEAKTWEYEGPTDTSFVGTEGGAGATIFSTLIIGKDAYGVINHENGNLRHIFKNFGSGGTSDPLDQRATAGWKAMQTAVRLVESAMVRIESTASKL